MDFTHRLRHTRLSSTLHHAFKKIRGSLSSSESSNQLHPFLKGLFLISLGLCVAWKTDEIVRREALDSWLRAHPPSLRSWTSILSGQNFKLVQNSWLADRAVRSLPAQFDPDGGVWVDTTFSWIVWFPHPRESGAPEVFNRSGFEGELQRRWSERQGKRNQTMPKGMGTYLPKQWRKLAVHWGDIEKLVIALTEAEHQVIPRAPSPKKPSMRVQTWRDPRQIDY